ncbi:MAG: hypothetical protein QGG55_06880, partial [Verrucomicrobiota bacterium]|nr:hypothetical protein [Verrucomicrobiota bacterium]
MAANNKTIQVQSNVPPVAPQAGESHMLEILIIVGILVAIALFIWLGGINFIKRIFGTKREREVRKIQSELVPRINALEEEMQSLSEDALREKTRTWQKQLGKIEDKDELARKLESILPEAFAVVKNACRRLYGQTIQVRGHDILWEMIPFDVQLVGGYALHSNRIAEMATGEGKTLVATLPVYLNALSG